MKRDEIGRAAVDAPVGSPKAARSRAVGKGHRGSSGKAPVGLVAGLAVGIVVAGGLAWALTRPEPLPPEDRSVVEGLQWVKLDVSSVPFGAKVLLDGADGGKLTPATFTLATGKEYVVDVLHPDCLPFQQKVFAAPKTPMTLSAPLTIGGRVRVRTDAAGARLELDGKGDQDAAEPSPPLAAGKHQLLVRAPGFVPEQREVEVKPPDTTEVSVKLDPGITVSVQSTPPGAELSVDGKPTSLVTPTEIQLRPGKPHTVKLTKTGFVPVTRTVASGGKPGAQTIQVELQDAKGADLKARIAALDRKVAESERKLKKLQAKQTAGIVVTDVRKEMDLERQITELEESVNQDQNDLAALREELERVP